MKIIDNKPRVKEYRKHELAMARLLAKGARRLHLTSPTIASYEISVDNIPEFRSKSNSWVRNHINACAVTGLVGPLADGGTSLFEDGRLNFRNTAGITYQYSNANYIGGIAAYGQSYDSVQGFLAAGQLYGIVVGTSDSAESFDQHCLQSAIAHGNLTGQLYHNAQSVLTKQWISDSRKWLFTLQRTFTNNSGASIVIKELGYYATLANSSTNHKSMVLRDVLPSSVTVSAGQTLTVAYSFEYYF